MAVRFATPAPAVEFAAAADTGSDDGSGAATALHDPDASVSISPKVLPSESSYCPTATQLVVVGHEIASRLADCLPDTSVPGPVPKPFVEGSGAALADQLPPASESINPYVSPFASSYWPTAKHVPCAGQATPARLAT